MSSALSDISSASVELAIWHRGWRWLAPLAALDLETIVKIDSVFACEGLTEAVGASLRSAGYADAIALGLAPEIAGLAAIIADTSVTDRLRIRVETVEDDACRRFHADYVTIRLIATLVGQGTQWIDARAPDAVNQLACGDVALFKGRLWVEQPTILHRSPPIEGTGQKRLVLAIDPARPEPALLV